MFKRRVALVAAVAALGVAGLAGPALADDGPVRVHGGETAVLGVQLTCRLSDGEVVKFSKAKSAELVKEDFVKKAFVKKGKTGVRDDRVSIRLPAEKLPVKVKDGKHIKPGKHIKTGKLDRVIHLTCVWDGPAGSGDKEPGKKLDKLEAVYE
ncbi:hypothetical protein [Nonomuraea jiangxiensis]|uniref:Uncharacterized protein n=1 Tax=Nonomuraea jiangxiensis TaxID=633440 RepID=A0A1G7YXW5_9ACTN|nr:hypothetical protein [Nonomuraea jiangxiensis]SDH01291.1 hypothetical protein SAMN05421869_101249 [Nonomuraea jiangxiensis]